MIDSFPQRPQNFDKQTRCEAKTPFIRKRNHETQPKKHV